MSDRPRNDGFDELDNDMIRFPGTEPEDLTEEERAFTFEEDYAEPMRKTAPRKEKEDAVFSAMRGMTKKPEKKPDNAQRVDVLASALQKLSRSEAKPPEPNPVKAEPGVGAPASPPGDVKNPAAAKEVPGERITVTGGDSNAAEKKTQSPKRRAPVPKKAEKPPAAAENRLRRKRDKSYLVKPAPVTIGRDLRMEEMLVYDSELDEIDYTDEEDLPEWRDYMPIRFGRHGRVGIAGGILYALSVISVSIILACLCWMFAADVLALGKDPLEAIVTIDEYMPEGDDPVYTVVNDEEREIKVNIDQVANELKSAGIINYKWLFRLFSQISHAETKIDPGTYSVSTALDYRALVTTLQFGSGSQEITRITFPEGYSLEQVFALLEENHICRAKDLYDAAANYEFDYDFLEDLELGDPNRLEGYLFPDTYDFYQNEDASVAINRFLRNFNNKFNEDMREQADGMGYSLHEILTIASLIEKESANAEESPIIASVIYNRLNDGWALGLDSTINYILGTSTFDLSYDDLAIDDPYNTYLYEGLPPGPICNPGMSSIEAALNPESTNYWYWYAVDGESHFFTNIDERNAFMEAHPY